MFLSLPLPLSLTALNISLDEDLKKKKEYFLCARNSNRFGANLIKKGVYLALLSPAPPAFGEGDRELG